MKIDAQISGRGMAGTAMARALAVVQNLENDLEISVRMLERGGRFSFDRSAPDTGALAAVASPHGLHAEAILYAEQAGAGAIVCEKPVCVSEQQAQLLAGVSVPVAVCHGYRVMWGPRTLMQMVRGGELGELISIEGGYWQSSAAARAMIADPPPVQLWKNDPELSGGYDALIDIGSHWIDLALALAGRPPSRGQVRLSHINAEAPHRDTHALINLDFAGELTAYASVSKTAHGATNDFRIVVLGSKASAQWVFMQPDEIIVGRGSTQTIVRRSDALCGSKQRPFHGLGWLEGYVEILHRAATALRSPHTERLEQITKAGVPTLSDSLAVMRTIFALERL